MTKKIENLFEKAGLVGSKQTKPSKLLRSYAVLNSANIASKPKITKNRIVYVSVKVGCFINNNFKFVHLAAASAMSLRSMNTYNLLNVAKSVQKTGKAIHSFGQPSFPVKALTNLLNDLDKAKKEGNNEEEQAVKAKIKALSTIVQLPVVPMLGICASLLGISGEVCKTLQSIAIPITSITHQSLFLVAGSIGLILDLVELISMCRQYFLDKEATGVTITQIRIQLNRTFLSVLSLVKSIIDLASLFLPISATISTALSLAIVISSLVEAVLITVKYLSDKNKKDSIKSELIGAWLFFASTILMTCLGLAKAIAGWTCPPLMYVINALFLIISIVIIARAAFITYKQEKGNVPQTT